MLDIKWIRDHPQQFDQEMDKRLVTERAATILQLDSEKRELLTEIQHLQSERNNIAQQLARDKGQHAELSTQSKELKAKIEGLESRLADNSLDEILRGLPNILDPEVPFGADDNANLEIERVGTPRTFNFPPKQHFELGEALGKMDAEQAAKIAESRFTYLLDEFAMLERGLAAFMLDVAHEFGYHELAVPLLVNSKAFYGSGHLPKFGFDAFHTTDDLWLIPTAEVALLNYHNDRVLDVAELPFRVTAHSACFRKEAGSAGKDTRGYIRQHQFYKVELFSFTTPQQAEAEHQRMTEIAKEVLKRLELPFRTILKCSGDTGITALKTYDLEVWLPGQNQYREISSCSNCGQYQARRANIKYLDKATGKRDFVCTLNGSALAVGRTMIAVLENYQQQDGSIVMPSALQKYLHFTQITARTVE